MKSVGNAIHYYFDDCFNEDLEKTSSKKPNKIVASQTCFSQKLDDKWVDSIERNRIIREDIKNKKKV